MRPPGGAVLFWRGLPQSGTQLISTECDRTTPTISLCTSLFLDSIKYCTQLVIYACLIRLFVNNCSCRVVFGSKLFIFRRSMLIHTHRRSSSSIGRYTIRWLSYIGIGVIKIDHESHYGAINRGSTWLIQRIPTSIDDMDLGWCHGGSAASIRWGYEDEAVRIKSM